MSLRLYLDQPLSPDASFELPADAARHVQVRRHQPGDELVLFDGRGGEWVARVDEMGRRDVRVTVLRHDAQVSRELPFDVVLALGMPANERMDALIEKATELGVTAIVPLVSERSVLRLDGDRAIKRVAHWQAVAVGAAEQSWRTAVPQILPVQPMARFVAGLGPAAPGERRLVMSTGQAPALAAVVSGLGGGSAAPTDGPADTAPTRMRYISLSGPEGGLAPAEEAAAVAQGFHPISLGARILRADTAPLAGLAQLALLHGV